MVVLTEINEETDIRCSNCIHSDIKIGSSGEPERVCIGGCEPGDAQCRVHYEA